MSGALAARHTDKEGDKGRVDPTRVRRYWAGKAPAWAAEGNDADAAAPVEAVRTAIAPPVVVRKADDPRLLRLAQRLKVSDEEGPPQRHREIRTAEVVRRRRHEEDEEPAAEGPAAGGRQQQQQQQEEEEEQEAEAQQLVRRGSEAGPRSAGEDEEEVDEEDIARRRQALKERLRLQQQEQELLAAQEEEEEEEEESEYETDSEEEEAGARRLIKPVFVPKAARETIAEREALEAEEEQLAAAAKRRAAERKVETRQLLVEVIAADAAAEAAAQNEGPRDMGDVITDDEGDEEATYEAWVVREKERIRRDRAVREAAEKAAAEREKLANMTEEERLAWERANPKVQPAAAPKKKWKFMQKYWHKGAFFQDVPDDARATVGGEDIFRRDFSAPTGEDNFDKEALPAVMQVRNFGRSGRTKWKHLAAEDTTAAAREDAWYREAPGTRAGEAPRGAAAGGYSRTASAIGGPGKRPGGGDEFSRPKKFKT